MARFKVTDDLIPLVTRGIAEDRRTGDPMPFYDGCNIRSVLNTSAEDQPRLALSAVGDDLLYRRLVDIRVVDRRSSSPATNSPPRMLTPETSSRVLGSLDMSLVR